MTRELGHAETEDGLHVHVKTRYTSMVGGRPSYPVPFDPMWWYLTRVDLTALRISFSHGVGWTVHVPLQLCGWVGIGHGCVHGCGIGILGCGCFISCLDVLVGVEDSLPCTSTRVGMGGSTAMGWVVSRLSFSFRRRDGRGIGGCLRSHPRSKEG